MSAGPGEPLSPDDARRSVKRRSASRLRNKAITREYLVAVAGAVFELHPYEAASMRRIAAQARVSVGAISRHFPEKADLWRAAMGVEPPVDGLLSRSAGELVEALEALVATRTPADACPAWEEADALVTRLQAAAERRDQAPTGARARQSRGGRAGEALAANEVSPPKGARAEAKAATRTRILTAARSLFSLAPYEQATLRDICREAGVSMGAVAAHFVDKAEIWRAAMDCEPPGDSALTRAAGPMLAALRGLVALKNDPDVSQDRNERLASAWEAAEKAIAQAEGGLGGASPGSGDFS